MPALASVFSILIRVLGIAAVLVVTSRPPAQAEDEDVGIRTAKRHFVRGEKLFALGKFDDALDAYQEAFDAAPIPDFLFNIGQCHRNLGDYEAAISSFKKFLRLEPEAPNREEVEKLIEDLEEAHARGESRRLGLEPKTSKAAPPRDTGRTPIYKKWWFWTGLVVVGAAGGAGAYVVTRGPPTTELGHVELPPP